jgi:Tfp pilus assembly protein PilV
MIEQRVKETLPPHPPLSKGGRRRGNEKGIALAMVLILSAIALAVMAGLIYMITAGTQISGMQKRYKTALEAGVGGTDVTYQFIALRGVTSETSSLQSVLSAISPTITTPSACTGTDISGVSYTGWAAKLNTPSTSWSSACDKDNMSITPGITTSYDMRFDLGASPYPSYRVYTKIVDTVEGNSGVDEGLLGKGVVSAGSGEVTVVSRPYLYTIEVDAENIANPSERAKLSILYQY